MNGLTLTHALGGEVNMSRPVRISEQVWWWTGLALAAMLAGPVGVAAQGTRATAGAGAVFEVYTFGDAAAAGLERISLITTPLAARIDIGNRMRLGLNAQYAMGAMARRDGQEITLSGPTDTELRLEVPFGQDAVTVTAIAQLPTGKSRLTREEALLAGVIAADLLPFRITNWGPGGGFGLATAFARRVGETGMGLSVGYVVAREYEPLLDDEFTYRPGAQLEVQGALDRSLGTGKAALQFGYRGFGEDELGGANLYRAGDRYHALGSYAFTAGRLASGIVYAGAVHRNDSRVSGTVAELGTGAARPAQDLILLGAGLRVPGAGGVLVPAVDGRIFRSGDGFGQGFNIGLGGHGEWRTGGATLVPAARVRFGQLLVTSGVESGFVGAELSGAIRLGRPR
jgi:hypothetical protein